MILEKMVPPPLFYLKGGLRREKGETENEVLHVLTDFPNGGCRQGWARPKPGVPVAGRGPSALQAHQQGDGSEAEEPRQPMLQYGMQLNPLCH